MVSEHGYLYAFVTWDELQLQEITHERDLTKVESDFFKLVKIKKFTKALKKEHLIRIDLFILSSILP